MSIDDHWFKDCHVLILGLMITTYIKGYLILRKNNVCHLIHHHPLIWQTKTSWPPRPSHGFNVYINIMFDCFTPVTSWVIWIFKIWTKHDNTKQKIAVSHPPNKESCHISLMADMFPQISTRCWKNPFLDPVHKCQAPFPTQGTGTRGTCNRACPFSRCTLLVRGDPWWFFRRTWRFLYDFSGWCTSTTISLWLI